MIPAAVKTRPIQSLFQWIESPKNYSEESEWDPTKIVIIVKIHDLWDNNKCFTNSSYLPWCVVRQSDHRMSLRKLCLYHFSIFHQTPIDLDVDFVSEDYQKSTYDEKLSWMKCNRNTIGETNWLFGGFEILFCTILAIQSPWFQVELIPRIWNCLRFTKLQKFTFEKKLSFIFRFEKQL